MTGSFYLKNKKDYFVLFIDWIISMVGYTFILILISSLFKNTIYIDDNIYFWGFLCSVIIFVLNKTLKPILVWLTIPITGLTLGLFYPFINLIILKIVSFILFSHFEIRGIFFALLASILISILNIVLEKTLKDVKIL